MNKLLLYSFSFLCMVATSCDPTEEDLLSTPSHHLSVSIELIHSQSNSNIVSADVKAGDNSQIKKLEIFVDDSLIASVNTPVYHLNLETSSVKDGSHTLKALAYDLQGNVSESKKLITVANPLVTLTGIRPGLFAGYKETIFIVTDEESNLLSKTIFTTASPEIMVFAQNPTGATKLNIYQVSKGTNTTIWAYMNVPRGSTWKLYPQPPAFKKSAPKSVRLNNLPSFQHFTISTDQQGIGYHDQEESVHSKDITLVSSVTGDALVQFDTGTQAYYNFFQLAEGAQTVIDVQKVNKPSLKKTLQYSGAEALSVSLYGKPYKDFDNRYLLSQKYVNGGLLNYFYPNEPMESFYSISTMIKDGWAYDIEYKGIPATFDPLDAQANFTNTSLPGFNVHFKGTFDFYEAWFSNNKNISVIVFANNEVNRFKVPDLGALADIPGYEVNDFSMQAFTMRSTDSFKASVLPYNINHTFLTTGTGSKAARKLFGDHVENQLFY